MKPMLQLAPSALLLFLVAACSSGTGSAQGEGGAAKSAKQALTYCLADSDCDGFCGLDGECHDREDTAPGLWVFNPCRPGHPEGEYCAIGAHCVYYGGDTVCKLDAPCTTSSNCDTGNGEYCNADNTCHGEGDGEGP